MGENSQNIYSGATEILPSGDQAQFPHRTVLTVTQLRGKKPDFLTQNGPQMGASPTPGR